MKLGEVGLLTNDVKKLANFYKELLCVDNGSPLNFMVLFNFFEYYRRKRL